MPRIASQEPSRLVIALIDLITVHISEVERVRLKVRKHRTVMAMLDHPSDNLAAILLTNWLEVATIIAIPFDHSQRRKRKESLN